MAAPTSGLLESAVGGIPLVRDFGLNTAKASNLAGFQVDTSGNPSSNGVIVPIYEDIQANQFGVVASNWAVSTTMFVNDNVSGTYKIAGGTAVWGTASSSGILKLEVATGTTVIGSGTSQTSTGIDTSTTAATANNFILTTQTTITAGSRVNLIWSGTITGLAICSVNVVLQRLS